MRLERKYEDPQIGEVVFRKRKGLSRLSIRVHPVRGVSVSVPYLVPFSAAVAFFRLKRDWVLQTMERQKERYKDVPNVSQQDIDMMRVRAKDELPERLKELADRYGFTYNKVTIKHNSTNWGSCSTKGNINLNLNLVRLPQVYRDYVLLHELCHLRHPDHGKAFHLLLEHLCMDNVLKLMDEGDRDASELASAAAASSAQYPFDHLSSRMIKKYSLI